MAVAGLALHLAGCGIDRVAQHIDVLPLATTRAPQQVGPAAIANPRSTADRIVNGAKAEARRAPLYDASYQAIAYPGGDVAPNRGACTDVLIRALRHAGLDLQKLIHEDIRAAPTAYGIRTPDRSIDHRRVPNHLVFLRRHGLRLPVETTGASLARWKPGDLVYWKLDSGQDHCGVVSNERNPKGVPLVVHNLSRATQEDCLTAWNIVAHYRYPKGARR